MGRATLRIFCAGPPCSFDFEWYPRSHVRECLCWAAKRPHREERAAQDHGGIGFPESATAEKGRTAHAGRLTIVLGSSYIGYPRGRSLGQTRPHASDLSLRGGLEEQPTNGRTAISRVEKQGQGRDRTPTCATPWRIPRRPNVRSSSWATAKWTPRCGGEGAAQRRKSTGFPTIMVAPTG